MHLLCWNFLNPFSCPLPCPGNVQKHNISVYLKYIYFSCVCVCVFCEWTVHWLVNLDVVIMPLFCLSNTISENDLFLDYLKPVRKSFLHSKIVFWSTCFSITLSFFGRGRKYSDLTLDCAVSLTSSLNLGVFVTGWNDGKIVLCHQEHNANATIAGELCCAFYKLLIYPLIHSSDIYLVFIMCKGLWRPQGRCKNTQDQNQTIHIF